MNKFNQQCYTYLIGWRSLDLWYYGYRGANKLKPEDDLWKVYFTSSEPVRAARIKHGEPDVIKISRKFDNRFAARKHEKLMLDRLKAVHSPRWLNQANGGVSFHVETVRDPAIGRKISASKKGHAISEETKEKMRQRKLSMTPEERETWLNKMKETLKGRVAYNKGMIVVYKDGKRTYKSGVKPVKIDRRWTTEHRAKLSEKAKQQWQSKKKAMQVELSASPCFSIEIEADLTS